MLIFITGATSGIGRATAHAFAKAGHELILTGRRCDRLGKLKQQLREQYGITAGTLCFDITNRQECEENLNQLGSKLGQIDVLINNAGKAKGFDPIHDSNVDHWEEMIDTNLKGLLYITRLISPHMVAREKGHIINLSSTAGKEAYPNGGVYCATKHGVEALTKGIRMDLHKYGIRVSQVAPGHVEETEFAKVRFDGDEEKAKIYKDFQPLKSSDVADAIFFIATRPAHVNIQDILIMGTQQASGMIIDRSGR